MKNRTLAAVVLNDDFEEPVFAEDGDELVSELYNRPDHLIRRASQIAMALFIEEVQGVGVTQLQYVMLRAIRHHPNDRGMDCRKPRGKGAGHGQSQSRRSTATTPGINAFGNPEAQIDRCTNAASPSSNPGAARCPGTQAIHALFAQGCVVQQSL